MRMQAELPRHVAIIMDGNGRWATERELSRIEGHKNGALAVKKVIEAALEMKIPYITLYAFSSENWSRPKAEVDGLMHLLNQFLKQEQKTFLENQIRLRTIGRLDELPDENCKLIQDTIQKTKQFYRMHVTVALNYSSKNELVDAVKGMLRDAQLGKLNTTSLEYSDIASYLYTKELPDPDLIIRTSGEFRLSNFLLLQSAYAEIYVTPTYWPDFDQTDFQKAIDHYSSRDRRYGNVRPTI